MTVLRNVTTILAATLLWTLSDGARAAESIRADGLVATVAVEAGKAKVAWRYEKSLPSPLRELSAHFNGRALPLTSSRAYPAEGDTTALMFVVDITGGEALRQQTYAAKARLLRLYDSVRSHHAVALGAIDGGLRLVLDRENEAPDPMTAMLQLRQTETAPELGTSLQVVIEALAAESVERRAAFIFTDGFSETRIDAEAIIDLARKDDVALNMIVEPSTRPSDLVSLRRIADQTGGVYAEGEDIARLLQSPYALIDSGAYADVELGDLFYYPWEDGQELVVTFRYGEKVLELSAPVAARHATARESLAYLWNGFGREVAVVAAGAGWAIALVGMMVGGSYRRRARKAREREAALRAAAEASPQGASEQADAAATPAVAESPVVSTADPADPGVSSAQPPPATGDAATPQATPGPLTLRLYRPDGTGHIDFPLEGDEISIGRGDDNDVVLKHASVSGRHALLIPLARNGYALQNLSKTNPTRINGQAIIHQELSGSEKVQFGEINAEIKRMEPAAPSATIA